MTLPKPVREIIREVVTATEAGILSTLQAADSKIQQVHYICAPPEEVIEILKEMTLTQKHMMRKYPAIILLEDISIQEGRADAYYGTTTLNIVICTQTQPEYKSDAREAKTFIPILRPLLEAFKTELKRSKYFAEPNPLFPALITERKKWGKNGLWKTEGNLFADHIDAIEIENLELTLRQAPVIQPFRNAY